MSTRSRPHTAFCLGKFCGSKNVPKMDPQILRQVPTAENVSDIATKVLSRGRLLYLMHETGLVYIPSFEMVGEEETANHKAKVRSSAQIKRIAKAVYRMSLVMGLGPLGAMGQPDVCPDGDGQTTWNGFWIFATVFSLQLR